VRDSHQNVSDFFLNVQKYWIFHFSFIGWLFKTMTIITYEIYNERAILSGGEKN
jgi:hypothetical protein